MNQDELRRLFAHLRICHGIAMRVIAAFPEEALDRVLVPNMRTPKQLIVHLYQTGIRSLAEGVAAGEITTKEEEEAPTVERLRTRDAVLAFCRDSWEAAERAAAGVTDAQLAGKVKTPWGAPVDAGRLMGAIGDELFHHRGQLYVFLRILGIQPPDMYDFRGNAPEYQPRTAPQPA